jgi:hypothetical protein
MFSRRAGADEIAAELATLYPSAPDGLVASFAAPAPRRGDRLTSWVHEQVCRAAVVRAAHGSGIDAEPYPADGEDSLRVYLDDDVADAAVDAVPQQVWAQARDEAWGDHGEALAEDRLEEWSQRLAVEVSALLEAWRAG